MGMGNNLQGMGMILIPRGINSHRRPYCNVTKSSVLYSD